MALIDKDQLKKFKEALADIIVSSQGLCTYDACKDVAEREATFLISMLLPEPNIQSSNIIATIRAEIERRYADYRAKMKTDDFTYYEGMADALDLFEQFIDSLSEQPKLKPMNIPSAGSGAMGTTPPSYKLDVKPDQPVEETPEPYTGIYDEAYLQEKIAKATKSWEGVDVDKMLAECRGYEQPVIKKSNALFDKCVKNCDPAVMKEVSDNVDKMLGRQPVEDLEEAAEKYLDDNLISGVYSDFTKVTFIAGVKWDRAKMMEKAVKGRYMKADGKVYVESWPLDIDPNSVKAGDEVRLLVIPEEK